MNAIAVTSFHSQHELANENVIGFINDYTNPLLNELFS
jgi:hypothetical protein